MYELWGKRSMRSSALASLFRYAGRRTRLLSRAEAAIVYRFRPWKLEWERETDLSRYKKG
jgi:hypothetical protein